MHHWHDFSIKGVRFTVLGDLLKNRFVSIFFGESKGGRNDGFSSEILVRKDGKIVPIILRSYIVNRSWNDDKIKRRAND